MSITMVLLLLLVGSVTGIIAGLFGSGGGILIVPGLMYLVGFSQQAAIGTSLAVMLPPIGIAAVMQRYRHGDVDIKTAMILSVAFFVGAWLGSLGAYELKGSYLKCAFGVFVAAVGCYISIDAWLKGV